jgi:hypothetical protein
MSLPPALSDQRLHGAILRFVAWWERHGRASHDPYDLWGTRYGLFARRLYYEKHPLGLPLIAPIVAAETFCPSIRKLFVRKQRFATADAQLLLAFLLLHQVSADDKFLQTARALADDLLDISIPGYRGHCWGYPFDWQNNSGLWRRNTPFITSTPYCYEAFARLFDVTREERFAGIARSAANFVFHDLNDTPVGDNSAAGSYGPHDNTLVINASAYRAFVLFDAANRFGLDEFLPKAHRNLNFILENQRSDGSWLYALRSPGEAFIDHFHTCFVLKNLHKIDRLLSDARISQAVQHGHAYYRKELFSPDGLPRSFAIQPRTQLVRLEMYNIAEAITLGVLVKDLIPGAFEDAKRLAAFLIDRHQVGAGYFTTRVFIGGLRHTFPFIRWPQSQLFYALTNLLASLMPHLHHRANVPAAAVASVK